MRQSGERATKNRGKKVTVLLGPLSAAKGWKPRAPLPLVPREGRFLLGHEGKQSSSN